MDLSIIIVNWNSKDYLRKCIGSILANTTGIEFEIIVIDSASFDGCDIMLRQYFPHVQFIQSRRNLGFAKANNEAFKVSRGKNILFLNPDTEIKGRAINALLQSLESMPSAGATGARLLNSDGSIQTSCVRAFPTILNQALDNKILQKWFPLSKLWGMAPLLNQSIEPTLVEAISGACLMVRRIAFEAVGLFSIDYFMYSEDIDLCFKLSEKSWKIYYIPDATLIHHGGKSSSQHSSNTRSDVIMLESRWRLFCKIRSYSYGQLYRFSMLFVSLVRILLLLFSFPVFIMRGKASSIIFSLKKWGARLRWAIGLENWVNEH